MFFLFFITLVEQRNRRDDNLMFVGKGNPLFDFIVGLNESNMLTEVKSFLQFIICPIDVSYTYTS